MSSALTPPEAVNEYRSDVPPTRSVVVGSPPGGRNGAPESRPSHRTRNAPELGAAVTTDSSGGTRSDPTCQSPRAATTAWRPTPPTRSAPTTTTASWRYPNAERPIRGSTEASPYATSAEYPSAATPRNAAGFDAARGTYPAAAAHARTTAATATSR